MTEVGNDNSKVSKQKQIEYNNFFNSETQNIIINQNKNYHQVIDPKVLKEIDLLSLSQMLLDKKIQAKIYRKTPVQPSAYQAAKSTGKKRQASAAQSKKRNNSQQFNSSQHNTHSFHTKQSQIQQLLKSFYQNQQAANSRTNTAKNVYGSKGNSTLRETRQQSKGPQIFVSQKDSSSRQRGNQANLVYSSIGSNSSKINATKGG